MASADPRLDAAAGAALNFLAAGDAPVYVGFGSMTGFDGARLLDALIGAIAGRRALFHPGWSGIDPKALPDNFLAIGDTPHDWLFPRTSAVIHHGGSGTSHSAARSGVPSIVAPFAGDQFFWAERLRRAGVASAPVSGRRPEPVAFAKALDFAAGASCETAPKLLVRLCARRMALRLPLRPSSASCPVDAQAGDSRCSIRQAAIAWPQIRAARVVSSGHVGQRRGAALACVRTSFEEELEVNHE